MMHRALILPEIVAAILNAGAGEPGLLYNSLLVNHLFFQEASRILWATCDSFEGAGQTHPDIQHLGALVLQDDVGPERAQIYANLVRSLSFHYEKMPFVDQTSWHSVLRQLQFPQLGCVRFWETDHATALNTEDAILHYACSKLHTLEVEVCGVLSSRLFDTLSEICLNLQHLTLRPTGITASTTSIVRALESMPSLQTLNFGKEFRTVLSPQLLEAIASCPRLEQLTLPVISDDVLYALQGGLRTHQFPRLRYLYTSVTAATLELLCHIVPDLEAIGLSNQDLGRTNDILSVLSRFRGLKSFFVELSASSSIRGAELLQLTQCCPELEDLKIGLDSWCNIMPSATEITNDLILAMAPGLANLKQLNLLFNSDTRPGVVKTLQVLGQHCPQLEELLLTCQEDWQAIANISRKTPIVNLVQLHLHVDRHMKQCLTKVEHDRLLSIWQENAAAWLPRMEFMNIHDADKWEEEFMDTICPREGEEEH